MVQHLQGEAAVLGDVGVDVGRVDERQVVQERVLVGHDLALDAPDRLVSGGVTGVTPHHRLPGGGTQRTGTADLFLRHGVRSEEHTSELQSSENLVLSLMLEIKYNSYTRTR